STRPDSTPRADHGHYPSSLIVSPCGSRSESLLKPCKGRFDILASQWLRKKFLDSNSKPFQEHLRFCPRGRQKHFKVRRCAEEFTDTPKRLLRTQLIQFEQEHVGRAGPLSPGHQVVAPARDDLFKCLPCRFVPTIDRNRN